MSTAPPSVLVVHPGAELFGSDRMLLESVIGLVGSGAQVTVAVPESGPLVEELKRAGADVRIGPMLVLRKALMVPRGWPLLVKSAISGLVSSWKLLGELAPDAVYVSTIVVPQWPVLARLRRIRAVSHIHEAEASGARILSALLYLPHIASERTLVNSEFCLSAVGRVLPSLARRCQVVLNGVAAPEMPPPPRGRIEGALRVLYLGRLSPRKGPDLVIEAAARVRSAGQEVKVTLVGTAFTGYEWFEKQLRESVERTGLDVEFAGFRSDVWPYLAEADVLVVPSRLDESFGNTAVEGVLAMRPVIASDSSGLREAVKDYPTARLTPLNDPGAIADAMLEFVTEWPKLVDEVTVSHTEALRRHAPDRYRMSVADAVLGGLSEGRRAARGSR